MRFLGREWCSGLLLPYVLPEQAKHEFSFDHITNSSILITGFNAQPAGLNIYSGVPHFQEVAFVFDNENGVGYPPIAINPFQGKPQNFFDLARLMSKSWVSFMYSGDPNDWALPADSPAWPVYSVSTPMNQVFDANVTGLAYAEPDTFRAQGQALINEFNIAYNR